MNKTNTDELKKTYGYRMQGFCCGNCKHKSNLETAMCYRDSQNIFSVAETAVCDNFQNYRAKA